MKLTKKNALALVPSMLTAADLAIIEGGEAGGQVAPDGTTEEWQFGEGAALYCQTRPDGGQLVSEAYTPPGGPAVHNVKDTRTS
jgi:hypothetical protein